MATSSNLQAYLAKAFVTPDVFALRPDYRVLLIAVSGISAGGPSDEFSEALLQDAEASARKHMSSGQPVTEIPHVSAWREAYKAFGAKPNKHRNSLEALTRRITADGKSGLPRINRLTDIYNAICVKWQIPLGGEDLDKYSGAAFLKRADGTEMFEVIEKGERKIEHADKGEVVWCDEEGITCRRWNWRQGPRTALDEKTERVLFICDALQPFSDADLEKVGEELVNALKNLSPDLEVATRTIRAEP